jgi:regulator of replication initiation timing
VNEKERENSREREREREILKRRFTDVIDVHVINILFSSKRGNVKSLLFCDLFLRMTFEPS